MIEIIKQESDYLLTDLKLSEANMSNSEQFRTEIIALLDTHHKKVILNLRNINYIDSTFLGALVAALKHAISLKLDIILIELNKDIKDLISLIRLDKVFKIYDNLETAI